MKVKTFFASLILLTAAATTTGFAQTSSESVSHKFSFGALGGLNIPKLTGGGGNPLSEGWASRSGYAFGLTLHWNTGSHFGWQADLLYSSEGGKRDGMQAFAGSSFNPQLPDGTYLYANYDNESILNYFEIPVMAKYSINLSKSSKLYVDLGLYVGFLLNAKQETSGSSIVYADAAGTHPVTVNPQTGQSFPVPFNASTDVTSDINTVNFGLTGGIGFSQGVGFGDVFLDIRGAYGLTSLQKDSKNGSNHSGNLLLAVGYSIPL
jgi:hypothetical protein